MNETTIKASEMGWGKAHNWPYHFTHDGTPYKLAKVYVREHDFATRKKVYSSTAPNDDSTLIVENDQS